MEMARRVSRKDEVESLSDEDEAFKQKYQYPLHSSPDQLEAEPCANKSRVNTPFEPQDYNFLTEQLIGDVLDHTLGDDEQNNSLFDQTLINPSSSPYCPGSPDSICGQTVRPFPTNQSPTNSETGSTSTSGGGTIGGGTRFKDQLYKTEFCRNMMETNYCKFGDDCRFAHSRAELRTVSRQVAHRDNYRTQPCVEYNKGICYFGSRCWFLHERTDTESMFRATQRKLADLSFHPLFADSFRDWHTDPNKSMAKFMESFEEKMKYFEDKFKESQLWPCTGR